MKRRPDVTVLRRSQERRWSRTAWEATQRLGYHSWRVRYGRTRGQAHRRLMRTIRGQA